MSVSGDITATYRGPGRVVARLLAMPVREGRVLAYGLGFCLITFIAYLPRLSQESGRTGQDLDMAMAGALVAWGVMMPLVLYLMAALSHLMARGFGGRGEGYGARLALFWSLFASSPLILFYGLVAGFTGSGPAEEIAGGLWLAVFVWFWLSGLRVAEKGCAVNGVDWRALVVQSVRDPGAAARVLIDMRVPTGVLWQALFLASALNAILFTLSNMLMPPPMPLPTVLTSPLWYLGFVAGGLTLSVLVLFQAGRALGGGASLADILVLMVWLQALRLIVQAALLVLMLVAPGLAAILAIAAGLVGVYIIAKFVNEAHGFNSLGRSALVLLASVLAMAVAMTVVMAFTGTPISEFSGY